MKPRDYCCCAIPILNTGIYLTLIEQLTTALLVGILSLATPSIVGAATPSFASWILAIICFVAAAIQLLGFIGVGKEKPILYRRYVTLHLLVTLSAFAVAAAWIIVSASRHSTAKSKCLTDFFSSSDSSLDEGDALCEIFPWVDVGIMGGLWVVLGILHIYLYVVLSSYGSSQRRDHEKYDQLNNEGIPMNKRNDPWDTRPSFDSPRSPTNQGYNHVRQESAASVSEILGQPQQIPSDSLSTRSYRYQQDSYPHQRQASVPQRQSIDNGLAYPTHRYSQDQTPTPTYHEAYSGPSSHRPPHAQAYPSEL